MKLLFCMIATFLSASSAFAQASDAELAGKLSNPVTAMISVPLQSNVDYEIGEADGWRNQLNVQPVVPIELGEHWNLISRTIVPITYQDDISPEADDQFGFGDTTQSLFLSPRGNLSRAASSGVSARLFSFPRQAMNS